MKSDESAAMKKDSNQQDNFELDKAFLKSLIESGRGYIVFFLNENHIPTHYEGKTRLVEKEGILYYIADYLDDQL